MTPNELLSLKNLTEKQRATLFTLMLSLKTPLSMKSELSNAMLFSIATQYQHKLPVIAEKCLFTIAHHKLYDSIYDKAIHQLFEMHQAETLTDECVFKALSYIEVAIEKTNTNTNAAIFLFSQSVDYFGWIQNLLDYHILSPFSYKDQGKIFFDLGLCHLHGIGGAKQSKTSASICFATTKSMIGTKESQGINADGGYLEALEIISHNTVGRNLKNLNAKEQDANDALVNLAIAAHASEERVGAHTKTQSTLLLALAIQWLADNPKIKRQITEKTWRYVAYIFNKNFKQLEQIQQKQKNIILSAAKNHLKQHLSDQRAHYEIKKGPNKTTKHPFYFIEAAKKHLENPTPNAIEQALNHLTLAIDNAHLATSFYYAAKQAPSLRIIACQPLSEAKKIYNKLLGSINIIETINPFFTTYIKSAILSLKQIKKYTPPKLQSLYNEKAEPKVAALKSNLSIGLTNALENISLDIEKCCNLARITYSLSPLISIESATNIIKNSIKTYAETDSRNIETLLKKKQRLIALSSKINIKKINDFIGEITARASTQLYTATEENLKHLNHTTDIISIGKPLRQTLAKELSLAKLIDDKVFSIIKTNYIDRAQKLLTSSRSHPNFNLALEKQAAKALKKANELFKAYEHNSGNKKLQEMVSQHKTATINCITERATKLAHFFKNTQELHDLVLYAKNSKNIPPSGGETPNTVIKNLIARAEKQLLKEVKSNIFYLNFGKPYSLDNIKTLGNTLQVIYNSTGIKPNTALKTELKLLRSATKHRKKLDLIAKKTKLPEAQEKLLSKFKEGAFLFGGAITRKIAKHSSKPFILSKSEVDIDIATYSSAKKIKKMITVTKETATASGLSILKCQYSQEAGGTRDVDIICIPKTMSITSFVAGLLSPARSLLQTKSGQLIDLRNGIDQITDQHFAMTKAEISSLDPVQYTKIVLQAVERGVNIDNLKKNITTSELQSISNLIRSVLYRYLNKTIIHKQLQALFKSGLLTKLFPIAILSNEKISSVATELKESALTEGKGLFFKLTQLMFKLGLEENPELSITQLLKTQKKSGIRLDGAMIWKLKMLDQAPSINKNSCALFSSCSDSDSSQSSESESIISDDDSHLTIPPLIPVKI